MLCIANPGHAPEAAPRKILQIFRGDPDFANRKLKKRRCNMQNNRRKFPITAAGWAAYESMRALVAARRTSPQRSVSRELSACTPCGSFSRRRKCKAFAALLVPAGTIARLTHFCSAEFLNGGVLWCARGGFFFSAKRAAKPPKPGYVMTKVDVRGCAAVRDSLIKSRWGGAVVWRAFHMKEAGRVAIFGGRAYCQREVGYERRGKSCRRADKSAVGDDKIEFADSRLFRQSVRGMHARM